MLVGFGSNPIEVQPGLQIIGSAPIRSVGTHDVLNAKAAVFRTKNGLLAILSLDLLCVDSRLTAMIRRKVAEGIPVSPERIMVAATHTHGGPGGILSYTGGDRFQRPIFDGYYAAGETDESLLDKISESCAVATRLAYQTAKKATLLIGRSKTEGIGTNREVPGGPFDPDVSVIAAVATDGQLLGLIYNYACHPTVLTPGNPYYTADFTGLASILVEDSLEGHPVVMYLNGACGDVSTRYTRRAPTFEEAERFAKKLSYFVLEALDKARPMLNIAVGVQSRQLLLPGKVIGCGFNTQGLSSKQMDPNSSKPGIAATGSARTNELVDIGVRIRADMEKSGLFLTPFTVPAEIQVLSLGELVLVGVPGELFAEYGLQLKFFSETKTVCTVGYANGYIGYLTSAASYERHSYESLMAVVKPGEAAKIIVEQAKRMIG